MENHRIVSRDEWITARKALLARENRAPKGRNERSAMDFVRRDDEYDTPRGHACCGDAA